MALVTTDQPLDVDDGLTIGARRNGNAILHWRLSQETIRSNSLAIDFCSALTTPIEVDVTRNHGTWPTLHQICGPFQREKICPWAHYLPAF